MEKRNYLKRVKSQLMAQRIILILCIVMAVLIRLCYIGKPFPAWALLCSGLLAVVGAAAAVAFNVLALRVVEKADQTLDAVLDLGGSILVEEDGWEDQQQIDPELLQSLREMVKEFLNLGSTQEIIRTQTNLVALQNQINPHFLYNTLDVIRSEAIIEGAKNASDMIETLSRLFRYGISTKEDLVPLSAELKNVQDYFRIQQYRFMDRYVLRVSNPQQIDCEAILVPKLTLQPLVENAILHAFHRQSTPGTITIRLDASERKLKITVSDDGCGMRQETLRALRSRIQSEAHGAYQGLGGDTTGIALENINKRIKLFFGDDYGLSVFSLPAAGTDIVITVPVGQR